MRRPKSPQDKSPQDIIKRMFPETKIRANNLEQRAINNRINSYQKMPNIGIISRGMVHEKVLAKQIGGELIPYDINAMLRYRKIIYLGPFVIFRMKQLKAINQLDSSIKIIIWWIGTDVYNALHKRKYNVRYVRSVNAKHFCVSKGLQDELKTIGIKAEVLTLVPNLGDIKPLPLPNTKKYTVAVYMPSTNPDFYKIKMVRKIIEATPKINYHIYGNTGPLIICKLPNVICRGWVSPISELFKDCHCLLRLSEHDGYPKGIMEAMRFNRVVICNHSYPKVIHLKDYRDIIAKLREHPKPDIADVAYYKKNFDPIIMRDRLQRV